MSNEIVEVEETLPTTSNSFEMVDVESAKAFMQNYQEVVEALLDDGDYQKMGKNKFKKKSAWRKLQTAFNISDSIVKEETEVDENNQIISSKFYVKATLPNGRSSVGVGVCSIFDKITKKDAAQPSNFVLRNRFNNAEHDVPSTAHTRAKSRAISDLIGAGEVSAEEMEGHSESKKITATAKPKTATKTKTKPKAKAKTKPKAKTKEKEPAIDEEAIEVQVVESKKRMTLKDLMDNNNTIKMAVDELQEKGISVNRDALKEYLKNKADVGAIVKEDYEECMKLME